jgi:hypothetical protein
VIINDAIVLINFEQPKGKRGKWFQGGLKAERARCLSEARTSAGFYASERDALGERATLKSNLPSEHPSDYLLF